MVTRHLNLGELYLTACQSSVQKYKMENYWGKENMKSKEVKLWLIDWLIDWLIVYLLDNIFVDPHKMLKCHL